MIADNELKPWDAEVWELLYWETRKLIGAHNEKCMASDFDLLPLRIEPPEEAVYVMYCWGDEIDPEEAEKEGVQECSHEWADHTLFKALCDTSIEAVEFSTFCKIYGRNEKNWQEEVALRCPNIWIHGK